jgi:hypothetical protein
MEKTARVFATKYRHVLPFFADPRPADVLDNSWRVADALGEQQIFEQGSSLNATVNFFADNRIAVSSLLGNCATLSQGLKVLWEFIVGKLLGQLRDQVS